MATEIANIELGGREDPNLPNIATYVNPKDHNGTPLICSVNIRSLLKRETNLKEFLHTVKSVKILAIQEVFDIKNIPHFENYHPIYFRLREGRIGGGLAFLISSDIKFTKVVSPFSNVESLAIDCEYKNKSFRVINLYKPPKIAHSEYFDFLKELPIRAKDKELVILGDFNLDSQKGEDEDTVLYLASHGLGNVIDVPTRVTSETQTILDHCYTTLKKSRGIVFVTDELADHWPIALEIGHKEKKIKPEDKLIPLQNEKALKVLKDSLSKIDWSPVTSDNSINAFSTFQKMFSEKHTTACPLIAFNKKFVPLQPYMTKGLLKSRRTKMKLYRKAALKKSNSAWEKYKSYCSIYKKVLKKAKFSHYKKEFDKANRDTRKIWQLADGICGRKQGKCNEIGDIQGCNNDQEKSDKFAQFYSQIPYSLANELPPSNTSYKEFLPKVNLTKPFKFQKVTEKSVLNTIKGLKPKTSFSFDYVSNKQLKFIAEEICEPLTHLINLSFRLSYTPPEWKRSRIIPIFKSGDKELVSNYRPIALLSTMSKILEKEMSYQMWRHLEQNQIISNQQYGFKRKCCCEHLLIDLMDKVFKSKNKGKYMVSIFLDIRKAFDCVDHSILKGKLAHYGLPADWFSNYLADGEQIVFVGNKKSKEVKVNIGVRQGSILGPILFLVMIGDLSKASNFYALMYADDTSLLAENESIEELYSDINNELKKVESWFCANRLSIHPDKCRYILFSNEKPPDSLRIGGKEILQISENSPEKSFKIVGLYLDPNINFHHHIAHVRKKVGAALALIARRKRHLPNRVKLLLFNALIQSHIQFAISIWGSTSDTILDPLVKLQKKCIRVVMGANWVAHCDPLWRKSNCLKLKDLHELSCCKLAYKIVHKTAPAGLDNAFESQLPRQRRNETFPQLRVPFARINTTQNLPAYQIPFLWNSLPRNISMKSPETFQRSFKQHKMTLYEGFICTVKGCFACKQKKPAI